IIIRGNFRITTTSLPDGTTGIAYNQTVASTGGANPITWSVVDGNLPGGISLATATGELSGTPTTAGSFTFTLQASDANSQTARQTYTVSIIGALTITTQSLPNGRVNIDYSASVSGAGGATPFTWSISVGALPDGLSIDAGTGAIAGSPSRAASFTFTVQLRD